MGAIIKLIIGIFKSIFEVNMENPYEESEEMIDVSEKTFDNPDAVFTDSDW
jgi:hypothetical protein